MGTFFRSRYNLGLEILALRQQLGVLKRKNLRPRIRVQDRVFWVLLRRLWPSWSSVLVIVRPEDDCRLASGRVPAVLAPSITSEVPRQAAGRRPSPGSHPADVPRESLRWGAPRIHGELLKPGFDVSERTVSRYLRRLSRSHGAGKRWITFLRNHRDAMVAMDFFTVPTVTFRMLYCFFVIEHGRRRILHVNVTDHPAGSWIVQQLREAFPETCPYRYAILDRDGKFGRGVPELLKASGMKPIRIAPASPWQNGVAERWVGTCRREILDHVLIFNEVPLLRLAKEYLSYYHTDRTHDGLEKDTPANRPVTPKPSVLARVDSSVRLGGLHLRYDWQQAA